MTIVPTIVARLRYWPHHHSPKLRVLDMGSEGWLGNATVGSADLVMELNIFCERKWRAIKAVVFFYQCHWHQGASKFLVGGIIVRFQDPIFQHWGLQTGCLENSPWLLIDGSWSLMTFLECQSLAVKLSILAHIITSHHTLQKELYNE